MYCRIAHGAWMRVGTVAWEVLWFLELQHISILEHMELELELELSSKKMCLGWLIGWLGRVSSSAGICT